MLRLGIRNVGPIAKGHLDVSPLTVVIGPNNSGKSVVASLVYAVFNARSKHAVPVIMVRKGGSITLRMPLQMQFADKYVSGIANCEDELEALLFESKSKISKSRVSQGLADAIDRLYAEALRQFGRSVVKEIERCFGERLKQLVRSGIQDAPSTLELSGREAGWTIQIDLKARPSERVTVLKQPSAARVLERVRLDELQEHPERSGKKRRVQIVPLTLSAIHRAIFASLPDSGYYLPAARSGILQSHKALASFLMQRSPLAGIEDMQIPRMNGVVADFISELLEMEARTKGPFHEIASSLESQIMRGSVQIKSGAHSYPEISYRTRSDRFALHRTSSMISELAPVVLYLRNVLDQGDALLIEEPESHLHPQSQGRFAEILCQLVANKLDVFLTTHSDYFLTVINACIVRGTIEAVGKGDDHKSAPVIEPNKVRAYLLVRRRDGASVIRGLDVSPDEGIPEDEFADVAASIYDELQRLDSLLAEA